MFNNPNELTERQTVSIEGGCFVAGSLVHTKEGLKPIEQIQVGEWVLSRPEMGGEPAYKRVTRTLAFEGKVVWTVEYILKPEFDLARAENRFISPESSRRLVVTENHPFWVEGKGWTQASSLEPGDILITADGGGAEVTDAARTYRYDIEGVAWVAGAMDTDAGQLVDLRNQSSGEFDVGYDSNGNVKDFVLPSDGVYPGDERSYLSRPVYNLEVEEFHTYYVGTAGVWVHNTNCAENLGVWEAAVKDGLIPPDGTSLVFSQAETNE